MNCASIGQGHAKRIAPLSCLLKKYIIIKVINTKKNEEKLTSAPRAWFNSSIVV